MEILTIFFRGGSNTRTLQCQQCLAMLLLGSVSLLLLILQRQLQLMRRPGPGPGHTALPAPDQTIHSQDEHYS